MKDIFRSLFLISLTVVFGWFSTTVITLITTIFQTTVTRLQMSMLTGLFVNMACASNFFVYYALSKEYRGIFNEHLHIHRLEKLTPKCFGGGK
ncbi:hypothetical protein ANCDUO_21783, partial [Ancylostoma duodenale]